MVRTTWILIVALVLGAGTAAGAATTPDEGGFTVRWARTMSGPTSEDEIDGVAAAPDRSVYVTGKFEDTATLGDRTLRSAGAADIPLARFDARGRPLWSKRFGGPGEDNFFDIAADARGAVATGWFAGTVDFGPVALTSEGQSDCVIASFRPDGSTRWARRLGGPGADGCNEVSFDRRGAIATSIDTQGGWTPHGGDALPSVGASDTALLRLGRDGSLRWTRPVGGTGAQRGKSLAVAPDGSVAFGGDTRGPIVVGDERVAPSGPGGGRDAFLTHWSDDGDLEWVEAWGGPGDDLVKGVVDDGGAVYSVGAFTGALTFGSTTLDAGVGADILVARRAAVDGRFEWATAVTVDSDVEGAELASAPDGGILFGNGALPGLQFGSTGGPPVPLDDTGGTAWLAHYRPDGTLGFARTIPGTTAGRVGEIGRTGGRVYVDVVLRGARNTVDGTPIATVRKDGSVWALDLAPQRRRGSTVRP